MESRFRSIARSGRALSLVLLSAWPALSPRASSPGPDALGRTPGDPARPNVLLVTVDDLRPELGCYGQELVRTPSLDRLAARGMVFERAYCQQALCSPSRSSLMTGARPETTRVHDQVTHFREALPDVVTLGQQFKRHGYHVQGLGKVYHQGLDDPPTWSVPWQAVDGPTYSLERNRGIRSRVVDDEGNASDETEDKGGRAPSRVRGPVLESADVPDETYVDGKLASLAIRTLGELAERPEPFLLAVGFHKPHLPFVAPRRYWDLYDRTEIPLAPNPYPPEGAPPYSILPGGELRSYFAILPGGKARTYEPIPAGPIPKGLARQLRHGYFAAVSYVDAQIGRLLDELDRLGLAESTLVVVWGDHGWKLGEHDAWGKNSNAENDLRAPLLVAVPGMENAGRRTRALVEMVDVYPTLCELAGLPLPQHLEGTSFVPLLLDPDRPWKTAAFGQCPRGGERAKRRRMGYTMRTDRYRLTVWTDRDDPTAMEAVELYDHETDPQENVDLAGEPGSKERLAELLEQWRRGWRAALPAGPAVPAGLQAEGEVDR